MIFKPNYLIFSLTLIMGTMICICASSWFMIWLGLEINLMSMIPLMLIKLNINSTEAAIKYFLPQAMASLLIIMGVNINININLLPQMEYSDMIIILALMIKLGTPPFHFWFPQTLMVSDWNQCLILMTWQKIAPFIILSTLKTPIMFILAIGAALLGCLGGLNQNKMKLIMGYSSINHSGWMLMASYVNLFYWILYFLIYSTLTWTIIKTTKSINNLSSLYELNNNKTSKMNKYMFILNLLSLGGLPPLLGFISKVIIIKTLMMNTMMIMTFILITASLISIFFYCRVIYSAIMMKQKYNYLSVNLSKSQPILITLVSAFSIMAPILFMV